MKMPFFKVFKEPRSRMLMKSTEKNGLRHAIFNTKKDKYKGEWKNNVKHGKGAQVWTNNFVYEGDWLNGKRHGHGVLSKKLENGHIQLLYEGEWAYGKQEGEGIKVYHGKSGVSYYHGELAGNRRQGHGMMWYADGSFYDGQWEDDKREGLGLFVCPKVNRYEGHWKAGKKHGYGEMYHLNTGQVQAGMWDNDVAVCTTMSDILYRQACTQPTPYPIHKNELLDPDYVFQTEYDSIQELHYEQYEEELYKEPEPPSPPPEPKLSPWFYEYCCGEKLRKRCCKR